MDLKFFFKNNLLTDRNVLHLAEYSTKIQSFKLPVQLFELLKENGGSVVNRGLFRIHNSGSAYYWSELCSKYFNFEHGRIFCFGFDWLGRNHAVDLKRPNTILILDYATGEYFELVQTLSGYFKADLVEYRSDTLSEDLYEELMLKAQKELKFDECYTFKIPLFLGGEDSFENYEVMNMEVCWEINHQLYLKANNLPEGEVIGNISID